MGEEFFSSPSTSMNYIYDQFGIPRNISDIRSVEKLESLKRKSQGNPWPVIEECLKIWKDSEPKTWESYLYRLEQVKSTRRDQRFGQSRTGMYRYTLDIPQKVMFMIRCLYDDEELPMNKEFFHEFARRFPRLKVAEKN